MGQFSAIMRTLGMQLGFYDGADFKTARYCDPIVDTWADVVGACGGVAFAEDDEAKMAACAKLMEICGKFNGLVEKTLAHHKGKFAAGAKMTCADFVLASYCSNILMNPLNPVNAGMVGGELAKTPLLKAYCDKRETVFPHLVARGPVTTPF